jgi:hypothetical protein
MAALYASKLEMLMMQPPLRRAVICLATVLHPKITPRRLVDSIFWMASWLVRRSKECCDSPAQFTR